MTRRAVSLFALAAFCFFSWSCSLARPPWPQEPHKTVKKDIAEVERTNTKYYIVNVITKSGANIAFGKREGARFLPDGGGVTGTAEQQLEFDKKDVKISYKGTSGKIGTVETADGRIYRVLSSTEEAGKILVKASGPITIPCSDIQQVWILKTDVAAFIVFTVVTVGAIIALMFA
jgi:hypothetical protein